MQRRRSVPHTLEERIAAEKANERAICHFCPRRNTGRLNPGQEPFNLKQGRIFISAYFDTPRRTPLGLYPAGFYFGDPIAGFKRFYDPIILPDGRKLMTLRDAAEYITALPKAEREAS